MKDRRGIVIAGGGAVGLTAALALAKKRVPVTVLEAEPELPKELRASTFHPPTLEMLDELGLTEKLIAQGLIADKFQFRDTKAGKIAEFDLAVLKDDTRYPFRLQLEQYALSVLAYEALQRLPNADVRFGHKVVNTVPAQDHVVVIAETSEGRRQFVADYVIGADGAHSEVRRAMGIPFEGMTYPELYLVQFTTFDFLERIPDLAHVNYVFSDEDWFVLLHSPGVWRILFPMSPEEAALDALPDDATLELRGQACLQKVVATGQPYPVVHRAIYQVHQRVAQSYRSGYVLLAGDAAHVNNPLGGMGLNGGIHDAINLSGKLARVWHGQASDKLLDAYSEERRQVATQFIQRQTSENAANIAKKDPETRNRFYGELSGMAADPVKARQYLLRTSMIESVRAASADASR